MITRLLAALRARLRGRDVYQELDDELQFHVESETEANRAKGLPPTEARRRALADLGSRPAASEGVRDARAIGVESIWRDVAHALRRLRTEPGFSAAAILTLALGIGANTAVFGIIDALLLRPLPYPHPERVVEMSNGSQGFVRLGRVFRVHPPELAVSQAFEALGLYISGAVNIGGESPARVAAGAVTPGFFDALSVPVAFGRTLVPTDEDGDGRVVVLSDRLWRSRFGGDPAALGQPLVIDGTAFDVVGVMPPGVAFPAGAALWIPTNAPTSAKGTVPVATVLGRLREGVSAAQARVLVIEAANVDDAYVDRVRVEPIRDALVGGLRPIALVVWLSAALVLLVACINATNLLLARVSSRRREFAVRRALGATTGRLVQQTMVESGVIAALGTLVALPAAWWTLRSAALILPSHWHGVLDISLDGRSVAVAGLVALAAGTLLGLGPSVALRAGRPVDAVRTTPTVSGDGGWRRFRHLLLMGEVAICLVLMAGATTLVLRVQDLMAIDLGVRGERTVAAEITLPRSNYGSVESRLAFFDRLEAGLRAVPGVEEVGVADQLPGRAPGMLVAEDIGLAEAPAPPDARRVAVLMSASPGYFSAVGLDVVAGRAFVDDDLRAGRSVAIVSTGVAEALGVTPSVLVGSTLAKRAADGQGPAETIVGAVKDVRLNGPDFPASPALYLPISSRVPLSGAAHIVVRAHDNPLGLAPSIRAVVAGLDSDLPVYHIETFDGIRARLLADRRLAMIAMLVFAGLTLALSAVGVYGVTSYLVQCRTREIGIRLAIGASPSAVCRQVLLGGAGRALAGIAVGVGAAMALGRLVAARVPGFESLDVAVLVALASGLLIVALLATLLPALRAMRVDPVRTLRAE